MQQIKSRWNLPESYLNFLTQSPAEGLDIENDQFENWLHIYGYADLIANQEGYSYNPVTKKIIEVWPKNYIVIADDGADPYVLDLSDPHAKDIPVLFAHHGTGSWDFELYASSFDEFLQKVDADTQELETE